MSYLTSNKVQAWLERTKFRVTTVDGEFEETARLIAFGKVGQRYDTTTWVDSDTTPDLILNIMGMLVASYELRRSVSENDGESSYPAWLESRAMQICDDIVSGAIEIGVDPDPASSLGSGAVFFPTDASTTLAETDPLNPDATPRIFSMNERF